MINNRGSSKRRLRFDVPWLAAVVAAGIGASWPTRARAAAGDCVTSNVNHGNTNKLKTYRINSSTFALLGINPNAGTGAVVKSADTWNEESNGGHFVLGRSTTLTRNDIPATKADCDAAGIDFSLVLVENTSGAKAETVGKCSDASGKATQFVIVVHKTDAAANPWNFSIGAIGPTQWDLVQTLTHELGHTTRLGHPANGENASMTPTSMGTNRSRDLYQWDLKCSSEISGHRSLKGYRRVHGGGALGAEALVTGDWAIAKISAGVTHLTGSWDWAHSTKRSDCMTWTRGLGTANTNCAGGIDNRVGIGPTEATWREDHSIDKVFYASFDEFPTAFAADAKHRARYSRSSNGFLSAISGSLSTCTAMTGFLSCVDTTPIYTGKAIAVGWDDHNNRTVTVWANQTRLNDAAERQLRVSVGTVNHLTLPVFDSLGVQSNIPPAVACDALVGGDYDCIVAFTDQNDLLNEVKIRRFSASAGPQRYLLNLDPNIHQVMLNVRTGSRLAVWSNNGKFWLAVRPIRTVGGNQLLELFSSVDGAAWVTEGAGLAAAATGPTAASVWAGPSNVLMYAR